MYAAILLTIPPFRISKFVFKKTIGKPRLVLCMNHISVSFKTIKIWCVSLLIKCTYFD